MGHKSFLSSVERKLSFVCTNCTVLSVLTLLISYKFIVGVIKLFNLPSYGHHD